MRQVLCFKAVFADAAALQRCRAPIGFWFARQIIFAVGEAGDDRGGGKCHAKGDKGRQRFADLTQHACVGGHRHQCRKSHGAYANRVDVVEVGAFEFDGRRAQAEWLVDHQIGNQRTDPGDCHIGIKAEDGFKRLEDAQFGEQQRDQDIEHHPHPGGFA